MVEGRGGVDVVVVLRPRGTRTRDEEETRASVSGAVHSNALASSVALAASRSPPPRTTLRAAGDDDDVEWIACVQDDDDRGRCRLASRAWRLRAPPPAQERFLSCIARGRVHRVVGGPCGAGTWSEVEEGDGRYLLGFW